MSGQDILQGPLILSGSNISVGGQDVQFLSSSTPSANNLGIGKTINVGSEDGDVTGTVTIPFTIASLANNSVLGVFPSTNPGDPPCLNLMFEFWRTDPFTPLSDSWGAEWWNNWGPANYHLIDARSVSTPQQLYDLIAPYIASDFPQLEFVSQAAGSGTWNVVYRATFLLGNGIAVQTINDPTVIGPVSPLYSTGGSLPSNSIESLAVGRELEIGGATERCIAIGVGGANPTSIGRNEKDSIVIGSNSSLGSTSRLGTQDVRDSIVIGSDISVDNTGYRYRTCVIGSEIVVTSMGTGSPGNIDGLYVFGSRINILQDNGYGLYGGSVVIGEYITMNGVSVNHSGYIGYNVILGRGITTYGQCNDNMIMASGGTFRNATYNVILSPNGGTNIEPDPGNWSWNNSCIGAIYVDNNLKHSTSFGYNVLIGTGNADFITNSILISSGGSSTQKSNYATCIGMASSVQASSDHSIALGNAVINERNCRGTTSIGCRINETGTPSFSNRGNIHLGNRIRVGSGTSSNIILSACEEDVDVPSTLGGYAAIATLHMPPQTSFVDNDYLVVPLTGSNNLILEIQRTSGFVQSQPGSHVLDMRDEGWVSAGFTWDTIRNEFQRSGFWPGIVEVINSNEVVEVTLYHPLSGTAGNLATENHVASVDFSLTGFSGGGDTARNILIGSENTVGPFSNYSVVLGSGHSLGTSTGYGIAIGYDSQIDPGVPRAITIGTGVVSNGGGGYTSLLGHAVTGSYGSHHVVGVGSAVNTGSGSSYSVFIGDGVTSSNTSGSVYIGKDVTSGGGVSTCIGIGHTLTIASGTGYAILIGNAITLPQGGNSETIAVGRTITVNGGSASNIALGIGITFAGDATPTGSHTTIGRTISVAALVDGVIVIGDNVTASYSDGIYIGSGSSLTGASGIAIGISAVAGQLSLAIGISATSDAGYGSIAIGNSSTASATYAIAIGNSATASQATGVAIGNGASVNTAVSVAIGNGASVTSTSPAGTALGSSASAAAPVGIAVGNSAVAGAGYPDEYCMAIGGSATASGGNSIAIGHAAATTGTHGIALGHSASAGANEMVIGNSTSTEAIHSFTVKGYNGAAINTFVAIDNPGTDECGISIVYNNGTSVANKVVKGAVSPPSGSILLYVDP